MESETTTESETLEQQTKGETGDEVQEHSDEANGDPQLNQNDADDTTPNDVPKIDLDVPENDNDNDKGIEDDGLIACRPCNVVFSQESNLASHKLTDYHKMVEKGFSPSVGKYFCYLCWKGYGYKIDLQDHYASSSHEEQVIKQNVMAIHTSITFAPDEEDQEKIKKEENEKRKRSSNRRTSESHRSERSRSPRRDRNQDKSNNRVEGRLRKNDFYASRKSRADLGKGLHHCVECNLIFISDRSEQLHRESQRHRAVFEKKRPLAPSGNQTPFVCFLCWWSYDDQQNLFTHYESQEHKERMKKYGVERLLVDSRLDEDEGNGTQSPPPDNFDDFVVLDEWRLADEEKENENKSNVDDTSQVIDKPDMNIKDCEVSDNIDTKPDEEAEVVTEETTELIENKVEAVTESTTEEDIDQNEMAPEDME